MPNETSVESSDKYHWPAGHEAQDDESHQPRPLTHTVLGGLIPDVTRTLLDWLLQHLIRLQTQMCVLLC